MDALAAIQYRRSDNSGVLQYLHTGNLDYNDMCPAFRSMFTQPRHETSIEVVKRFNRNHGHDYDDENLTDRDCEISEIDTNKDLKTQLYEAVKTANTSSYGPSNAKNDP